MTLQIENWIAPSLDGVSVLNKYHRDPAIVRVQVIHRLDIGKLLPERGAEAAPDEVAAWFGAHPEAHTACMMPYHFLVRRDGRVQQCLPVSIIGNAARKLNRNGVQIAVDGDFRYKPPSPAQALALTELCTILYQLGMTTITGHTEQVGCSLDAKKECPGAHLVIDGLRLNVRDAIAKATRQAALKAGLTLAWAGEQDG